VLAEVDPERGIENRGVACDLRREHREERLEQFVAGGAVIDRYCLDVYARTLEGVEGILDDPSDWLSYLEEVQVGVYATRRSSLAESDLDSRMVVLYGIARGSPILATIHVVRSLGPVRW